MTRGARLNASSRKWRSRLDAYLSMNCPRLWSHQTHIAVAGCAFGIVVALLAQSLIALPRLKDAAPIFVLVVAVIQVIVFVGWAIYVLRVPRPANVIEYHNSPLIITVIIYLIIMMCGPIALFVYNVGFSELELEVPSVFAVQLLLIIPMFKLNTIVKADDLGEVILYGFFSIFVAGFIVYGILLIGLPRLALSSAAVIGVLAIAFRTALCFYTSRRRSMDNGLVLLMFVAPLALAATTEQLAPIVTAFASSLSFSEGPAVQGRWMLAAIIAFAVVWLDVCGWIMARWAMLPKAET